MGVIEQIAVGGIGSFVIWKLLDYYLVDRIVNDLMSRDGRRVIRASLKIKNIQSRIRLRLIAVHYKKIKNATMDLEYEEGGYPKYFHKEYAIRKLHFVCFTDGCFCKTFVDDHCFDIYEEQKKGTIAILEEPIKIRGIDGKLIQCKRCHRNYRALPSAYYLQYWNINEYHKIKKKEDIPAGYAGELKLDIQTIETVLETKNTKDIDKLATLIIGSVDIDVLKELSTHINKMLKLFSLVEYDENEGAKRDHFNFALGILNNIQFGNCYCRSYIPGVGSPEYYGKLGTIRILEERVNAEAHEIEYDCECSCCRRKIRVKFVGSGLFGHYIWNYNSKN
jgi:hypothetical protein